MCMARTPNTPPQAGRTGSGRPTTGGVREAGDAPVAARPTMTLGAGAYAGPDGRALTGKGDSTPAESGVAGINRKKKLIHGGFLGMEDAEANDYTMDPALAESRSGKYKDAIDARMAALGKEGDPDAYKNVQAQQAGQSDFRNNQKQLADLLYQQAMGQGPSAAQSTLQLANDKAINAQMSMARSGGNPAAMRQAMFNAATLTQQNAGEAASLRANEMMAGRQLYGNQLQGMRGADETLGMFNAGQGNVVGMDNAKRFQDAMAQKEQFMQNYIGQGSSMTEADRVAAMQLGQINLNATREDEAIRRGAANTAGKFGTDLIMGGVNTAIGAGMKAVVG